MITNGFIGILNFSCIANPKRNNVRKHLNISNYYYVYMELFYILQASLMSKYMKDPISLISNPIAIAVFIFYLIHKCIPYCISDLINEKILEFIENDENVSCIVIPYHLKLYNTYNSKPLPKTLYSERFHAINHHIKKYHMNKITSMVEILNFENTKYLDNNSSDYILIPKDKQKICLNENLGISIEIIFDSLVDDDDKDKKRSGSAITKKYIYKISKQGSKSVEILNKFITDIEKEYKCDTNKHNQMVFEYKKTYIDDYDNTSIMFTESPFYTNKSFDNTFFEKKSEILEFLQPFIRSKGTCNSNDCHFHEKYGVPFKGTFLLHGPPGCGKSSFIKSTIKFTKRHCVLVSWTKLKTCNDFLSLFRPIKIDNRIYEQSEVVIVFEDFDANNSKILKTRGNLSTTSSDLSNEHNEIFGVDRIKKICEDSVLKSVSTQPNVDELSLEYILNVLDGIVELHDSLVFFTTNDIESIDPALKRVGRIDKIIKMDYINRTILEEILNHYYDGVSYKRYSKSINKIVKSNVSYANIIHRIIESPNIEDFFHLDHDLAFLK